MPERCRVVKRWWIASLLAVGWLSAASDLAGQGVRTWRVSPEAIEMGKGAGELFQSVLFGRLATDGRVVVADVGQLVIRIYGRGGERQAEMGGSGAGPGEFRAINGLWLVSDGRIAAWDAATRRITTFDTEGLLVDTHRVTADGEVASGNLEVFLGSFSNEDVALASLEFGQPQSSKRAIPDRWVLGRFGLSGGFRGLVGEVRGMWRMGGSPVPFSPMPQVTVYEDSMWVADGYESEITVRDEKGVTVRTIELPRVALPSGDAWSSLGAELRRRNSQFFLQRLERVPRSGKLPQVAGLLVDDRGYLWVKVYDPSVDAIWLKKNALQPGPGGEWRVFRPDGETVATLRMPDNVTPLDIRGNRLLGLARDSLDVESVGVHTVERD